MGLQFNGTNRYLHAPYSAVVPQPFTIMAWVRAASMTNDSVVGAVVDQSEELSFVALETYNTATMAMTFNPYAEADGAGALTSGAHLIIARFSGSEVSVFVDGTKTTHAWSPAGSCAYDLMTIGANVRNGSVAQNFFNGIMEHFAVWGVALSDAECAALYNLSVGPLATQVAHLLTYHLFKSSLADEVAGLTWTAEGLVSPAYTNLGVEYPSATGHSVTYNGNGSVTGSVPVDASSPYDPAETVTVLGNSGSLARPGYAFAGWNTAANGSGTAYAPAATFSMPEANVVLYAQWTKSSFVINHENCDASVLTTAQVARVAGAKIYMEHASTGQDILGDSTTDSSAGMNNDGTLDCGLKRLHAANARYLMDRDYAAPGNDATWFATHSGLQNNMRSNPTPAVKLSGFVGLSTAMKAAVDVAMFKYCWIDVWPETTGYISDGAARAASDTVAIEAFKAANPDIVVPYWTMPLQSNASYAAREAYNRALRTYCAANGRWLIDIADIECHNSSGVKQVDGNGREVAESTYVTADGGHLSNVGSLRMANAFWVAMASMSGPATYGVTYDDNDADSGSIPVDSRSYEEGEAFTVLGNSGNLVKAERAFGGWNTTADGSGTTYGPGDTPIMGAANVTLYAKWVLAGNDFIDGKLVRPQGIFRGRLGETGGEPPMITPDPRISLNGDRNGHY